MCAHGGVTHLYLQLLNHLHLDSALSGAAVIEGVLIVQVPEGERTREEVANQLGLDWLKPSIKSTQPMEQEAEDFS